MEAPVCANADCGSAVSIVSDLELRRLKASVCLRRLLSNFVRGEYACAKAGALHQPQQQNSLFFVELDRIELQLIQHHVFNILSAKSYPYFLDEASDILSKGVPDRHIWQRVRGIMTRWISHNEDNLEIRDDLCRMANTTGCKGIVLNHST